MKTTPIERTPMISTNKISYCNHSVEKMYKQKFLSNIKRKLRDNGFFRRIQSSVICLNIVDSTLWTPRKEIHLFESMPKMNYRVIHKT